VFPSISVISYRELGNCSLQFNARNIEVFFRVFPWQKITQDNG